MHGLPRWRSARTGPGADARGTFAELPRATALRHAARQPERRLDPAHDLRRCRSWDGRSAGGGRLPCVAEAVGRTTRITTDDKPELRRHGGATADRRKARG